jgi:flagellar biosynthesis chaperone FliJ
LCNISFYQEFLGLIENIESDFVSIINSIDKISEIRRKYNSKIDLDNILRKMKEKKQEKENELQKKLESESSDDLFRSIQLSQGKKRGRPRKSTQSLKGL